MTHNGWVTPLKHLAFLIIFALESINLAFAMKELS